ncbi:lysoplasmalogenase [Microbulbifer sp. SSSA002]|uniref:lysoplasmalogenase n=1 Tax=unclassified Microbulbifer TaxID=2619833 RepID=UPI00403A49A5
MSVENSAPQYHFHNYLVPLFLLSAALFIFLDTWKLDSLWMPALKALPILSLLLIARIELRGATRLFTILALSFSACGDILLELHFPQQFVLGLGAFLIAQLIYALSFLRFAAPPGRHNLLRALPVLLSALLLAQILLPAAGDLAPAVLAYLLAILTMAVAAAMHRGDSALLFIGAVTFMLSDTLIAINKFIAPLPLADATIMLTYYSAQLCILYGIRRAQA